MFEEFSYSSIEGLFLLIVLIFSGRSFRENWLKKDENWIRKSWLFGLISLFSFLILALLPMSD